MKNKRPLFFPAVVLFFVAAILLHALHPTLGKSIEQQFISLDVTDGTLQETLDQVSKISGYRFTVQAKWHDLPVTVHLLNVPLEQAILKILGNDINHAILFNDKEKHISIFINEISQKRKAPGLLGRKIFQKEKKLSVIAEDEKAPVSVTNQPMPLSGQGRKFEQVSRTTDY